MFNPSPPAAVDIKYTSASPLLKSLIRPWRFPIVVFPSSRDIFLPWDLHRFSRKSKVLRVCENTSTLSPTSLEASRIWQRILTLFDKSIAFKSPASSLKSFVTSLTRSCVTPTFQILKSSIIASSSVLSPEERASSAALIPFRASCLRSFSLLLKQSGWLQRSDRIVSQCHKVVCLISPVRVVSYAFPCTMDRT